MLVFHGSTVDIVHRGRYLKSKTEYGKQNDLPVVFNVLIAILSFAAVSEFWFFAPLFGSPNNGTTFTIAFMMIAMSLLISLSKATSPFLSKSRKVLFSLLFVLWAWVLTLLIIVFL